LKHQLKESNNMAPNKLNSTKRFAVRLSLVTGSTLAAIIGAQSLAALDRTTAPSQNVAQAQQQLFDPNATTSNSLSGDTALRSAPVITILRHFGEEGENESSSSSTTTIQPPSPVQVSPPSPVVVQSPSSQVFIPARPRTRTSR
jgi:hypothetical protein